MRILKKFKRKWNDWSWYYFQFTNFILSKYFSLKANNGIYVVEEAWANLIILDACRYDFFKQKIKGANIQGRLEARISRGSATRGFLIENFGKGTFQDIVYVTANPFVYTLLDAPFFKTVHLWRDEWDSTLGTVPPKRVENAAREMRNRYPNKRLIVHFMQPHTPFIGSYRVKGEYFWRMALRKGVKKVMKAYQANLDLVFPHVERLIHDFEGTTVVTSDHGDAFGEPATPLKFPIFGHPTGVLIPALVKVPWFIVEKREKD